ncbi:putative olfactory receptor 14L1 [Tachyglossus aculeatus]|uniref:putative olfactory receptor 14L1 n=1 Tax=Tachyglossus aculeatus TaxID=9261 RepID=UPI0018F64B2D|nr:putative olfactory receptor 14L1 [Tachyglossus aculeatus]
MYFFLKHLSILDLYYISVTVPKSITNSLSNSCSIHYWGCVAQLFLKIMLAISELFILTVISYDCYVSIFRPRHYEVIMNRGAYVQMAAATCFSGGLFGGDCSHWYEFGFISFMSIIISYIYIVSTVLTFPSTESHSKAFSTCLPHFAVITCFLSSGACAYLKSPSDSSSALDLMVSVFYTVVPRTLNPLIYSLRNREMKAVLKKVWG